MTNIAYMQLREQTGDLETISVCGELNIDLLPDGTVFGIEFLDAEQQFPSRDESGFTVVKRSQRQREDAEGGLSPSSRRSGAR